MTNKCFSHTQKSSSVLNITIYLITVTNTNKTPVRTRHVDTSCCQRVDASVIWTPAGSCRPNEPRHVSPIYPQNPISYPNILPLASRRKKKRADCQHLFSLSPLCGAHRRLWASQQQHPATQLCLHHHHHHHPPGCPAEAQWSQSVHLKTHYHGRFSSCPPTATVTTSAILNDLLPRRLRASCSRRLLWILPLFSPLILNV